MSVWWLVVALLGYGGYRAWRLLSHATIPEDVVVGHADDPIKVQLKGEDVYGDREYVWGTLFFNFRVQHAARKLRRRRAVTSRG